MCLPARKKHDAVMGSATPEAWLLSPWKEDPAQPWGLRLLSRWHHTLPLVATVLMWLATGSTMSSLNKWIFAIHNFRYPVLLSSLHMLTAVVVGRPLARLQARGSGHPALQPKARLQVFLLSLTFCSSVAFGNLGLNHVQLDFAQMVYTTTPLFTLTLSELLLGKRHHPLQYLAMGPICLGASLSIVGEVHFNQAGCCFLFAATFLRGLKSIQQSTLLQEEHLDSLRLLCLTSLPSFCLLFVAALGMEVGSAWEGLLAYKASLWTCVLLSCLGSVLYNLASFCILSLTSALTIHVLGNFNVVGNLLLSHWLFGSHLTLLSYAGIALTLLGVVMYHHSERIATCWRLRAGAAKKE
ncbi:solute carrier family 35 member E4 [Crotalus tigris]|uniref:solute carrier family 35 member E4 n=1 Tax=Crotalus tigris TaxID=88082 RepID=UPI00192F9D2F|nr:solute carrier family 35 member E4 [Crotalus tigris]XP_039188615.1 solute carrier family 35 member E4 [Crotalus tigris]XP_039188616.1 solute carrier family 35 member E4 [Crotalus tigris]XP_039188617.1 solute carrier family 35 member E4 [Crotalus tigris]